MSTTRREILKAAPLALLSGGFAIPLLSAFTEDDLKKAEKGKVIKQEPKSIEVKLEHPHPHPVWGDPEQSEWSVYSDPRASVLTIGPATFNADECEIVGIHAFKNDAQGPCICYFAMPHHYYLLRFPSKYPIDDRDQTFILSQTI